ncbi:MAG: hypothetical protein JWN20_763 [Jatrophihabitantaceae bacterium]|nr:hypothetical protein [Jatrophihabitantaceae bacterium]
MRLSSETAALDLGPRGFGELTVAVVNTAAVIDALMVRPIGLPDAYLSARPRILALFPEADGHIALELTTPSTFPSGEHRIEIEVYSQRGLQRAQRIPVVLSIPPRPAVSIDARPARVRARREAAFVLDVLNTGNIGLDVALRAADADRSLTVSTGTDRLWLDPGASARVRMVVRGPRMIFGSELDRPLTIEATGRAVSDAREHEVADSVQTVLRQRPVVTRGMLTAAILPAIIALWALVFLLGASRVLSNDPVTKEVPASFYASTVNADGTAAGDGGGTDGAGGAVNAAPAGALPKDGQVPAEIGGTVGGKVTAVSDGRPVGRLQVDAFRRSVAGDLVLVSSAATQADGSYTVAGLFPGSYLVRASATGFDTVWYPKVGSDAQAVPVQASAQKPTTNIDIVITGQPASITGTVSLGSTLTTVPVSVAARSLSGTGITSTQQPVATATTAADGSYALASLPAPASYELTFTAAGYQATTIVEAVSGGQARIEPSVLLSAGSGQISGTVTDGTTRLGGVTITTTVNGKPVTTGTPTTGAVGTYILPGLPTPGNYLLTFSLDGYGSQTIVIDLAAGQSQAAVDVVIRGGTGTVTGQVIDDRTGAGLGGASVSVGGGGSNGGTTSLTAGTIGLFVLSGLPAPGSYTLTVTLPGFAPQSVPVTLTGAGAPPTVIVRMPVSSGSIVGVVYQNCTGSGVDPATCIPLVGGTVTVTNGQQIWSTTSTVAGATSETGAPLGSGGYSIASLPAGTYALTITFAGKQQRTVMATVTAGVVTRASNVALPSAVS